MFRGSRTLLGTATDVCVLAGPKAWHSCCNGLFYSCSCLVPTCSKSGCWAFSPRSSVPSHTPCRHTSSCGLRTLDTSWCGVSALVAIVCLVDIVFAGVGSGGRDKGRRLVGELPLHLIVCCAETRCVRSSQRMWGISSAQRVLRCAVALGYYAIVIDATVKMGQPRLYQKAPWVAQYQAHS